MSVAVLSEPRVYAPGSNQSYFRDRARAAGPAVHDSGAVERLQRYSQELSVEIRRRTREGKRAERVIRQAFRQENREAQAREVDRELRAMSSGTGTGGEFVTPVYLMDDWAPALDVEPVIANQANNTTLPDYGLKVYVPTFSSGTTATVVAEGDQINLDSPDPATTYQEATVQTVSTGVTISQQLHDRGQDTVAFDQALQEQISLNLNAQLDSLVLTAINGGAQSTAGLGPASAGALWADIAGARERAYAANTRARATHVFTNERVFGWAAKITDSTGRPILEAQHCPGVPPWGLTGVRDADRQWSGYTGVCLPGGLFWFLDENVGDELLVSRPAATIVATSDPVFEIVVAGSTTGNLELVARSYRYVVAVPRIPSANQVVTGYAGVS